ncbi:hypothetical protein BGX27_003023 [Mortierella sp. AM989]|nr:hypothetical protein BGX27_003023 [Mortierella sp. AM989]
MIDDTSSCWKPNMTTLIASGACDGEYWYLPMNLEHEMFQVLTTAVSSPLARTQATHNSGKPTRSALSSFSLTPIHILTMQNDAFKRFSRDLQEALSIPGNFLNKKSKKSLLAADKKKKNSQPQIQGIIKTEKITVDSCSLHDIPISEVNKTVSTAVDNNTHYLSVSTAKTLQGNGHGGSPISAGSGKIFPKEEPPIIHCPPSISSLEHFSPQRKAWIQNWSLNSNAQLNNVLKSGQAWDTVDETHFTNQNLVNSAYNNPNEATGLLFVKLMQVTNKATTKIFDVEWSLRVGNVERTSYPARSFKDNPGNTATMNEVFLFDVHEPFQLEMTVTGNPVPTKFGTMAGFSTSQTTVLGQLDLSFCLENMDKSVRTYKLQRSAEDSSKSNVKSDCEVVFMIGLHVLEEPIEDRTWETATLYQGFLTVMTRGGRMASWKRYWAVLEGRAIKLYDAEYQQKRSVLGVIPFAHISRVQPPDYEKVDVGSNGFSMVIDPHGVDVKSQSNNVDPSELDYCVYAFTDSSHLHEVWNAHLDEALDQYQESMTRRHDLQKAKMARRATQILSRHSFESSIPPSPLETMEESYKSELVDLKYVW